MLERQKDPVLFFLFFFFLTPSPPPSLNKISCYLTPTHLFNAFYFRDVKLEHVLYPILQGDDGTGTAGA